MDIPGSYKHRSRYTFNSLRHSVTPKSVKQGSECGSSGVVQLWRQVGYAKEMRWIQSFLDWWCWHQLLASWPVRCSVGTQNFHEGHQISLIKEDNALTICHTNRPEGYIFTLQLHLCWKCWGLHTVATCTTTSSCPLASARFGHALASCWSTCFLKHEWVPNVFLAWVATGSVVSSYPTGSESFTLLHVRQMTFHWYW